MTRPSRPSTFVRSLPDEAIETHIAQAAGAPSELSLMHLYPIDGAVHRVARDATAWNAPDATWAMGIAGIDPDHPESVLRGHRFHEHSQRRVEARCTAGNAFAAAQTHAGMRV